MGKIKLPEKSKEEQWEVTGYKQELVDYQLNHFKLMTKFRRAREGYGWDSKQAKEVSVLWKQDMVLRDRLFSKHGEVEFEKGFRVACGDPFRQHLIEGKTFEEYGKD